MFARNVAITTQDETVVIGIYVPPASSREERIARMRAALTDVIGSNQANGVLIIDKDSWSINESECVPIPDYVARYHRRSITVNTAGSGPRVLTLPRRCEAIDLPGYDQAQYLLTVHVLPSVNEDVYALSELVLNKARFADMFGVHLATADARAAYIYQRFHAHLHNNASHADLQVENVFFDRNTNALYVGDMHNTAAMLGLQRGPKERVVSMFCEMLQNVKGKLRFTQMANAYRYKRLGNAVSETAARMRTPDEMRVWLDELRRRGQENCKALNVE